MPTFTVLPQWSTTVPCLLQRSTGHPVLASPDKAAKVQAIIGWRWVNLRLQADDERTDAKLYPTARATRRKATTS